MKSNKEQVLEEKFSMFSDKDFDEMKALGLSEDEIESIKNACAIVDTAEKLPKNIDKFFEKFNKVFPADVGKAMEVWTNLPKTDPKFFEELICLMECLKVVSVETPKVEKVQKQTISSEKLSEKKEEFAKMMNDFLEAYHACSPEEKEYINRYLDSKN